MSAILMCDMNSCNELFSVNEKGWTQIQQSIPVSENNPFNHGQKTLHMCPRCAPNSGVTAGRPVLQRSTTVALAKAVEDSPKEDEEPRNECDYCSEPGYRVNGTGNTVCAARYYTRMCEDES
jgi:hypothetical protein